MVIASSDQVADSIVATARTIANSIARLMSQMKSQVLMNQGDRAQFVIQLTRKTLEDVSVIAPLIEKLVPEQVSLVAEAVVEDIEALVEREMENAAEAIQKASKKLDALMDLNVHSSIIEAAKSLTEAVFILIKRATDSQQEIVSNGKGSTTSGAFYKKNNKWTEGLISAAKAVAIAVTWLVECADGLVNNNKSMEELIVAAQQVSVATTQLVAAARVKATQFSKTQDRLEAAAGAVRQAAKLLVKAAKEASKISSEQQIQKEVGEMSRHQFQVVEMEQQVKVLELEKDLQNARYKLAEIRKTGYTEREEYYYKRSI